MKIASQIFRELPARTKKFDTKERTHLPVNSYVRPTIGGGKK